MGKAKSVAGSAFEKNLACLGWDAKGLSYLEQHISNFMRIRGFIKLGHAHFINELHQHRPSFFY